MRRTLVLLSCFAAFALTVSAQQSRTDIRQNTNLAGSNYLAYRGPQKELTAAPAGYEPFYMSHYGRHGSRFLIGAQAYDRPYFTLLRADSLGALTEKGREVLAKVKLIREEAQDRDGELTLLGAEQHRQIARRIYERFPRIFAGKTNIDAKSTVVIRCILSMTNELLELSTINPQLQIRHDASEHDMYYMNDRKSKYKKLRETEAASKALDEFYAHHSDYSHLSSVLFKDAKVPDSIKIKTLAGDLLKIAANMQSTELRRDISLWEIFSEEEIYDYWLCTNAFWYMYYGPSKETGGLGMFGQTRLLQNIIHTADSCIQLEHPGATLRFGHESMVMPLVCLLNLNGYGEHADSLEELPYKGWLNYNIYPMAANVQFVFYKPQSGVHSADDVLVKVLLNEDEATLPVETDCAPYYRWSDVRKHYLALLKGK